MVRNALSTIADTLHYDANATAPTNKILTSDITVFLSLNVFSPSSFILLSGHLFNFSDIEGGILRANRRQPYHFSRYGHVGFKVRIEMSVSARD